MTRITTRALRAVASALAIAAAAPLLLAAPAAARTVTAADPGAHVDFEIFLPLRNTNDLQRLVTAQQTAGSASYQKWLTPAQYRAAYAPTQATFDAVTSAVTAAGMQVTKVRTRSIHVSGTAAQAQAMLGTTLNMVVEADGTQHMVSASKPVMAGVLATAGAKVAAFTTVPLRKPMVTKATAKLLPDNRYGPDGPYWYNDMKQAYDYPSYQSFLPNGQRLDGTGVHAAVLMADLIFPNDVPAFFNHEHFTTTTGNPVPTINTILVDGGGVYDGYGSFEASLDVQQIAGGAPGSAVTLYSIPDLKDEHILDGYQQIVDDNQNDVVNSSFGGCELGYTAAYNGGTDYTFILQLYEDIFLQGNAQGITFVASSGDEGGLSCPSVDYFQGGTHPRFVRSVQSPSDSPSVTGVGGGNLVTAAAPPNRNSAYVSENGFGDPEVPYDPYGYGQVVYGGYWGPGGGRSVVFARPAYQSTVNTGTASYRTIPDIGMQVGGCPGSAIQPCGPDRSAAITTYGAGLGGGNYGVIGTSVSSPEFVGALVLYIQKVGQRVGNINPYLYHYGTVQTKAGGQRAPDALLFYHRNIPGYDGFYDNTVPTTDYNYIYGNGSPDVRKLFGFTNFAPAGVPQSPSNP